MKKLQFSIDLHAPKEKIWKTLWDDATYRQWTGAFHEGSYAVGDWSVGSRVQFLTPDGTGMYSTVAQHIPNEFMSFQHLGEMKNGVEQPIDEETKKWSGSMETYILEGSGERNNLTVEVEVPDGENKEMQEMFPKALKKLKEIAEK